MKLNPLYDRILLRVLDERMTPGGLHIPDMALAGTPYKVCEVVAAGPGRMSDAGVLIPIRVKVGDVVMIFRTTTTGDQIVVPHDGAEMLLVREPAVVGTITELDRVSALRGSDGRPVVTS